MTPPHQVLFLCSANYYRSRYAEEVFNFRAKQAELNWRAFSRGVFDRIYPENVGPISRFTLEALAAKAIEPGRALQPPQPCSLADIDQASLIIAVKEAEHRVEMERRFPTAAERITYWHVHDIDFAHPSTALAMIDDHVQQLLVTLASAGQR